MRKPWPFRRRRPRAGALYRQGDIFIQEVSALPADLPELAHGTLAHGEVTGHSHRLEDIDTATLFAGDRENLEHYLQVDEPGARVVHDEHGPIALQPGIYRTWRQREYTPAGIVNVVD